MSEPKVENINDAMYVLHDMAKKENFQDNVQKFYESWADSYDEVCQCTL